MFLKRNAYQKLRTWKKHANRKPLLLRGARQVGKTSLVLEFGRTEFKDTVVLNFEEDSFWSKLFEEDQSITRIVDQIEIKLNKKIDAKNTLIFFDEIQQCPNAIIALRYFYEKASQYYIVAAGSLLEFALEHISFPVGRVESLYLYPFTFEEFLQATNRSLLAENIPIYEPLGKVPKPIPSTLHEQFRKALQDFLIVGGMPEAVRVFCESHSLLEVFRVQRNLINSFIDDSHKYARGDKQLENLAITLRNIPRYIGQEVTYTTLAGGDNHQRTKRSLELLHRAMVLTIVKSISPATGIANEKHFKCLALDVGLVSRVFNVERFSKKEQLPEPTVLGKLYEQFVGQELLANQDQSHELFCWIRPERTAKAEVDYMLPHKGNWLPIEVKSGALGKMRSVGVLLNEYSQIMNALVLSAEGEVVLSEKIIKLPIYAKVILDQSAPS